MNTRSLSLLISCLVVPYHAVGQTWKNECVGYYQLQLPDNLEVALYPIRDFIDPRTRKQPGSNGKIQTRRYADVGITFNKTYRKQEAGTVQAQFSENYYDDYELGVSSENNIPIEFSKYQETVKNNKDSGVNRARQFEKEEFRILNKPITSDADFDRIHGYIIKAYPNAFSLYERRAYTLYINQENRLYHFWRKFEKDKGDKSQTAEKQLRDSEPEVLSLLNRFRPRKLYEVPAEQGFCMPYGFIAGDSGQEERNIGVTYRLKDHPDVTIFFQDLGMEPGAGFQRPENETAKEFVTYLWNKKYQWSAVSKELISPKWRTIEMAGRKGLGTFAKSVFEDGAVDYGYVAYVRGNHKARNVEPDLLLYVMQYGEQAKGQPPMDKDELEKMAEHIVSSVKRR